MTKQLRRLFATGTWAALVALILILSTVVAERLVYAEPSPEGEQGGESAQALALSNAIFVDNIPLDPMEARLLDLLNGERVARGLAPLQLDSRLEDLARQRSSDMVARGYFGHVTPEGSMVFDTMNWLRIPYQLAGENLARNSSPPDQSPEVAHQGFMNSPTHAENDLDPTFNKVGIGVAVSGTGTVYFTELFALLQ